MKSYYWGCILFILITTVYFASAVGLMNSMDTPQYFTTEALLRYHDIDLVPFVNDKHFFVYPDIYGYQNKMLGLRGFIISLMSIPLHVVSSIIKNFFRINNFPWQATYSPTFQYELSVVTLFTLFSAIGILLYWKVVYGITRNPRLAFVFALGLGLGSYIWKYSASYIRGGIEVFLIAASIYFLYRWLDTNETSKVWLGLFLSIWSISFGVDTFLFIALSVSIGLYTGYLLIMKRRLGIFIKNNFTSCIPAFMIITLNVFGNYHWYGTFFFSQQINYQFTSNFIPPGNSIQFWMSTPLFPTIIYVLFSTAALPKELFSHFASFPPLVSHYSGISYAQMYIFYGLFIISPFVFWGVFSFFSLTKVQQKIGIYCFIVFMIGVILNTKFLGFWAGNQYDVRYFYPYILLPAVPAAWGFYYVIKLQRNLAWKAFWNLLCVILLLFSMFMGWIGVLRMFQPVNLGENRVAIDVLDIMKNQQILLEIPPERLMQATFMNRQNAWVGAYVSCVIILYSTVLMKLIRKATLMVKKEFLGLVRK